MARPIQNINHSAFRSIFEREKLSRTNFNDGFHSLKPVFRVEEKLFVIEQPIPPAPAVDFTAQVLADWNAVYDADNEELKAMFEKQARVKRGGSMEEELSAYLAELIKKKKKVGTVRYLKETMGYYFYFPPKNKIVVVRYAEFLEKNLISQEVSGRAGELEEIQDEDTSPSKNTSKIPIKSYSRSISTHRAPECLCLNVEVEEHSLGDLNKPTNYKAALLDLQSDKWLDAMNAEMQSMKDNQVWHLVNLASNELLEYMVVYINDAFESSKPSWEKTFTLINVPLVADIRAIRIVIAIAAFYDYEIWKMDVKTAFLNGYFDEDIYMVQPEGFVDPEHPRKNLGEAAFILGIKIYRDRTKRLIILIQSAYMDKILKRFKMDNSKCGNIPMQERFDLNKTQGASTPEENPRKPHWTAVKTILKYLRNTKDMFLIYGGNPRAKLRVDCYVRFEIDRDDIKSQTIYVFILNGGTLDCKRSKRSTTAMSAIEAEYVAASEAAMKFVWIRKFI
uniref:Reverse transcriptase Ty1/copia-type domain-containing protein n=1 Tax=Tanacetum cinerariifolium TaxID=118510 RepID=A0A699GVG6_TANCI|nr:hypothetical protein [Tanacetum cinerariifolium]